MTKKLSSLSKIFLILSCAIMFYACQSNIPDYQIGDDMSYFIIKPGDKRLEINSIVKEFKSKKNIDINLEESIYNTQDRLYKLKIRVKNSKSTAAKSVSPFKKAIAILIINDKLTITTPEKVKETMF